MLWGPKQRQVWEISLQTPNSFENIRMLHTNIQKTETRMCKALEQSANIFGSRRSSCWVDSMNTKLSLDM